MGIGPSKLQESGSLPGAYAPPLVGTKYLPSPLKKAKTYKIKIPKDKRGGDQMTVLIEGELTTVDIPIADPKAPTAYRSGDYFFSIIRETRIRYLHLPYQWFLA